MTSALARALKLTAYDAVWVFESQVRACMHEETEKRVGIGDTQGGGDPEALLAEIISSSLYDKWSQGCARSSGIKKRCCEVRATELL